MTPEQFKAWRKHRGETQAEAAKALGISKGSVELYESGQRRQADARSVVIPLTVELACAALSLGVTSYDGRALTKVEE